MAALAS